MSKRIFYDEDARKRVLGGAELLYKAVKTTLGPKGRNVVIGAPAGGPIVTHDGVTVAKNVDITDVDDETLGFRTGVELIKQAATKMNDSAGDGTTTVTVLTYHILKEANKLIAAGHNPMLMRKGLESAAKQVVKELDTLSEDISHAPEKIREVATISAGDKQLGELIADVLNAVGKDGSITVEAGQGLDVESEIVEGYTIDRGFVSHYMISDQARLESVMNDPAIITTDRSITSSAEISGLLDQLAQAGKKDVILIAEEVSGEALAMLILNKLKGTLNAVAIKAPSHGEQRKNTLHDIAILTGGKVISQDHGHSLNSVDGSFIGSAQKVVITKDATTIIGGAGDQSAIEARIHQLVQQADATTSDFARKTYKDRQAALTGKVGIIQVGGASETEIEEKKFRVDDAVAAVKAAMNEGIVPGGGVTLVHIASNITPLADSSENAGAQLLAAALIQPFRILLQNAGLNPDERLAQVRAAGGEKGIDVMRDPGLINLKANGIIDPTLVHKQAVQHAASIAGTGMTMGTLIVDDPTPKQ